MYKSRQDVLDWKTSASRKPGGISSTSKPNIFEILVDEGQVSSLLNLPRELRDSIYEVILTGTNISQQVEYNQRDFFQQGPGGSEYLISSQPTLRNHNKTAKLHSMVSVSKQISREFLEAVQRRVPVHLQYSTKDRGWWYMARYIERPMKIRAQELCKRVPSTAHMSVNSTFYSFAHERQLFRGPEDLQRDFLKQESFKNLARVLSVCKETTHVAFHCTLHVRGEDNSADSNRLPEPWNCKTIHDYLQTAVESMPKLLRYSLVVRISKPGETLHQIRYAQRTLGPDWDPAKSTQGMFNMTRCSAVETRQCAKKLKLLPEWRNLYEILRFQDDDIPDFLMGEA